MSLLDVWEASAANPYYPTVSKDSQFLVGFTLLFAGKNMTLDKCNGPIANIIQL